MVILSDAWCFVSGLTISQELIWTDSDFYTFKILTSGCECCVIPGKFDCLPNITNISNNKAPSQQQPSNRATTTTREQPSNPWCATHVSIDCLVMFCVTEVDARLAPHPISSWLHA